MGRQERVPTNPRELYDQLGMPVSFVDEAIDVLSRAETSADLDREITARGWTVDQEQFLLPLFRPLYEHSPKIKSTTLGQLEEAGVSRRLAHRYLTKMGNQPYVIFPLDNEVKIPKEVADRLIK